MARQNLVAITETRHSPPDATAPWARDIWHWNPRTMPSSGWIGKDNPGGLPAEGGLQRERLMRHAAKLDGDFRYLLGQALASAQVKRHTLPAPVIDVQLERRRRLRLRIRHHPLFLAIAGHLLAPMWPGPYCPRTALCARASGEIARTAWSTSTFLFRISSAEKETIGSMATRQSSCIRWFCTMSRSAPA